MTVVTFNTDQVKLIQDTICKGSTDEEFKLFLHVCQKSGLDPMLRQIYSIKRGNTRTIQTSIDGLRLIAERTGKYSPGRETSFAYDEDGRLLSATAYVKKMTPDGTWHETASTVFNAEYNNGTGLWGKMPSVMLSKCAESNALRRAFPAEMCGLYTDDEMSQADVVEIKAQDNKISKQQVTFIQYLLKESNLNDWFNKMLIKKGYKTINDLEKDKYDATVTYIRDKANESIP